MELECQLISQGYTLVARAPTGVEDGAAEWRLLLQLDTDEDAQMCWGDSGRLYFWIREADARACGFRQGLGQAAVLLSPRPPVPHHTIATIHCQAWGRFGTKETTGCVAH